MDVDAIPPGTDFIDFIQNAVKEADVVVAVIGKKWLDAADNAGRRLVDNPSDFVRMEIQTALEQNVRIIPALVDDAIMPRAEELPDDIKSFSRKNAIEITHSRFNTDVDRLLMTIETVIENNYEIKKAREKLRLAEEHKLSEYQKAQEQQQRKDEKEQEKRRLQQQRSEWETKKRTSAGKHRVDQTIRQPDETVIQPSKGTITSIRVFKVNEKANHYLIVFMVIPLMGLLVGLLLSAFLAAVIQGDSKEPVELNSRLGQQLLWGSTVPVTAFLIFRYLRRKKKK